MRTPPAYFDRIRAESTRRWLQLEADPQLAGPWRQLFRQITSTPAHVLSELLQNADDAGATHVAIDLREHELVVSHNGQDFVESDFAALCRFASSNKASLHTIGFRGIGFKSTFAVGSEVFVCSPSLCVVFKAHRFTLPEWVNCAGSDSSHRATTIRVSFDSPGMHIRLAEYLSEWSAVPLSLLFFNNLRTLEVNGRTTGFRSLGSGPVARSEWFSRLTGNERLLVLRDEKESLPEEGIEEVRSERGDPSLELPPIDVQIVLGGGTEGRLHVVLPTGVRAETPFASNAPFIQDPARVGLKDPLLSPTNRWLLSKIGRLASSAMLSWLERTDLPVTERVGAYRLLPRSRTVRDPQSAVIIGVMEAELRGAPLVLGADGGIHEGDRVALILGRIRDVWPEDRLPAVLGGLSHIIQHRAIADEPTLILADWCGVEPTSEDRLLERLSRPPAIPRPPTVAGLQTLWRIVGDRLTATRARADSLRCIPAVGTEDLLRPRDVTRLGAIEAELRPEWLHFLTTQLPLVDLAAAGNIDSPETRGFLARVGLDRSVGLPELLHKVAGVLRERQDRAGILRAGQIAGLANIKLEPSFPLVTQAGEIKTARDRLLGFSIDELSELVPESWARHWRISDDYLRDQSPQEATQWVHWLDSERSTLGRFPVPSPRTERISQADAKRRLAEAAQGWPERLPLRYGTFDVDDYDFEEALVKHWTALGEQDSGVWASLTANLAALGWSQLAPVSEGTVYNVGSRRRHLLGVCCPTWLRRLRSLPSVFDNEGNPQVPPTLLLGSPRTEPLRGVLPFVADSLDVPTARQLLIELGVRTDPTDVGALLDRLRSLSEEQALQKDAVAAVFRAINLIWPKLDPEQRDIARKAMVRERLIPSASATWRRVGELARANHLGLPAVELLHPAIGECGFLDQCGLPPQPRRSHLVEWVRSQSELGVLPASEQARATQVLSYLGREAATETGCWLAYSGEVRPLDALRYIHGGGGLKVVLFPGVASCVAMRSGNPEADHGLLQAISLRELDAVITRVSVSTAAPRPRSVPDWYQVLREGFGRLMRAQATAQDSEVMERFCTTSWCVTDELLVELWDGRNHIGPPQAATALWEDKVLYVVGGVLACEAGLRSELTRPFTSEPLRQLVGAAIGRSSEYVDDLIATHLPRIESVEKAGDEVAPERESIVTAGALTEQPEGHPSSRPDSGQPDSTTGRSNGTQAGPSVGSVTVLGNGGLNERSGSTRVPRGRGGGGWARIARSYLHTLGYTPHHRHPRWEDWRHPDGRRAELRSMPVHIAVRSPTGEVEQLIHVVPRKATESKPFPVYHETWVSLGQAAAKAYFLVATDSTFQLVGFGEVTRGGRTYPAAYMVQLPRDATSS